MTEAAQERLQKVLADAGVASRRASEALIAAGRVTVDGVVATVGLKVDPAAVSIAIDGRPLTLRAHPHVYVALDKPGGVTSTTADRHADLTVLDLVPVDVRRRAGRLYPVGRLDQDSEGLILLTNDGAWTERLLHPSHGVEREYAIGVGRPLTPAELHALEDGVELEEGVGQVALLRPMTIAETTRLVERLDPRPGPLAWYRGTLRQGWKRQVRRMFAALGVPVERLVRVRFGTVRLDDVPPQGMKLLSGREAGVVAPR